MYQKHAGSCFILDRPDINCNCTPQSIGNR